MNGDESITFTAHLSFSAHLKLYRHNNRAAALPPPGGDYGEFRGNQIYGKGTFAFNVDLRNGNHPWLGGE